METELFPHTAATQLVYQTKVSGAPRSGVVIVRRLSFVLSTYAQLLFCMVVLHSWAASSATSACTSLHTTWIVDSRRACGKRCDSTVVLQCSRIERLWLVVLSRAPIAAQGLPLGRHARSLRSSALHDATKLSRYRRIGLVTMLGEARQMWFAAGRPVNECRGVDLVGSLVNGLSSHQDL